MNGAKKAIVVLGGALNPVHQGHVQCLAAGKAEAERQGYEVLWCTFAPARDTYVKGKVGGKGHLNERERCEMVRVVVEGLGVDWVKAPTACYSSAAECGRKERPSDDVVVVQVVGSDRAPTSWFHPIASDVVYVCLPRGKAEGERLKRQFDRDTRSNKVKNKSFFISPSVGPSTSSTLIRRCFSQLLTSPDPTHLAALASHGYTPAMVDHLLRDKRSMIERMCSGR